MVLPNASLPFHWLRERHIKWIVCVTFCFASCSDLWSLVLEAWLVVKLDCSECLWRTLNRKGQLRHRAVSLRQHGFLVLNFETRHPTSRPTHFDQYVWCFCVLACVQLKRWRHTARELCHVQTDFTTLSRTSWRCGQLLWVTCCHFSASSVTCWAVMSDRTSVIRV